MPVYNSNPQRFRAALQSLLAQTFQDFELILSDNGSDDAARALYEEAVASNPRIRYTRHSKNYGAGFNFNYVFSEARGEYFMWVADDDLRAPTYLAKTVALLDQHPHAVTAGTRVCLVNEEGQRRGEIPFSPRVRLPRPSQRIVAGHFMDIYSLHRRTALAKTHLTQPMHGGDWMLVMEMLLQGPLERVDEELLVYKVPTQYYSMESLAEAAFGSLVRPMLFKYPEQHLALQMLVTIATNNVDLSARERCACLAMFTASLLWKGGLVDEPRTEAKQRALVSLRSHQYLEAIPPAATWLFLAPGQISGIWGRVKPVAQSIRRLSQSAFRSIGAS